MWERMSKCSKGSVISINLVSFFTALIVCGLGVWLVADRFEISELLGTPIYLVLVSLFLIAGGIVALISFLGWYGAYRESKTFLIVFAVLLVLSIIVLLVSVIMAAAFRGELGQSMNDTMQWTLKHDYGHSTHNRTWNWIVTTMWDSVQRKLNCCAVDDQGWGIYQESRWFWLQGTVPPTMKKYVPLTCCRYDDYSGFYLNIRYCQNLQSAPPNVKDGARNRFLFYDGCYKKGYNFVSDRGWIVFGVGIAALVIMILHLIAVIYLIRLIDKDKELRQPQDKIMDPAFAGGDGGGGTDPSTVQYGDYDRNSEYPSEYSAQQQSYHPPSSYAPYAPEDEDDQVTL